VGPNCFVEDNVAELNIELFDDNVEVLFELEFEFSCFDFCSGEISQLDSRSGGDCCNALSFSPRV